MQRFDFRLTQQDIDLTTEFMMYCNEHNLDDFTSDTFRLARLHVHCKLAECVYSMENPKRSKCFYGKKRCIHLQMQDPQHEIGAYFARLKANGVASPVDEVASGIESNNRRRVDVWRWNWSRWREIVHSRLPAYTTENP